MLSPYVISQSDPTDAPPDPGQQAAITAIAMLTGGGLAGVFGQKVTGAATAAENQVENNDFRHLLVAIGLLTPLAPDAQDPVSLGLTDPSDTLQEQLMENVKPIVVPGASVLQKPPK